MTTASGALRICQLPPRVRLDAHWPLQKVPLRATPHCLAFYAEARLYALLTSRQASARAQCSPGCSQAWVAWQSVSDPTDSPVSCQRAHSKVSGDQYDMLLRVKPLM